MAAQEDLDVKQTVPEHIAARLEFKPGTPLSDLYAKHADGWLDSDAFRSGVSPTQYIAFHLVDHLA